MDIDTPHALSAFRTYVDDYDANNPRIALKVDHSLRVANLCRRIAVNEKLSAYECDLAWLIGLLHDIGRFEQLRRWNTFSDAQSTNHAALGVEVLFSCENNASALIESFITNSKEYDLIRTAVGQHSVFRLPASLDERTRTFCTIVRDADKIDILHVMQTSTPETILNASMKELQNSKLSPAVLQAFNARRCVQRQERTYPADYVVGFICFVFELEHSESKRIVQESGDVFKLASNPFGMKEEFTDKDAQREFKRIEQELHQYLSR